MDINSKTAVIMMATYNGEKYILDQIKSLQDQTFINWNLYISDDGSTDNTLTILKKIQNSEPRIKKILVNKSKHHGAFANYFNVMNYVKMNCKNMYAYYFYCDQDDVWKKDKMSIQIKRMEEAKRYNKPVFCYSDLELCDDSLNDTNDKISNHIKQQFEENPINEFFKEQYVWGTAMAHDKRLWDLITVEKVNKVKNNIPHDSYVSRYAAVYSNILYIDKPLVLYRRTGNNVTGTPRTYSGIAAISKLFSKFPTIVKNAASTYGASLYFINKAPLSNDLLNDLRKCFCKNVFQSKKFFNDYKVLEKENMWNRLSTEIIFYFRIYKLVKIYKEISKY